MNSHLLGWIGGTQEFPEEETRVLMEGEPGSSSGATIRGKLTQLGIQDVMGTLTIFQDIGQISVSEAAFFRFEGDKLRFFR